MKELTQRELRNIQGGSDIIVTVITWSIHTAYKTWLKLKDWNPVTNPYPSDDEPVI